MNDRPKSDRTRTADAKRATLDRRSARRLKAETRQFDRIMREEA